MPVGCQRFLLSEILCNGLDVSLVLVRKAQQAKPEIKTVFESGRIQDSLMPSSAG